MNLRALKLVSLSQNSGTKLQQLSKVLVIEPLPTLLGM